MHFRSHTGEDYWYSQSHIRTLLFVCHTQSLEIAKDAVFPSRALRRQLTSAQQRLKDMQDELQVVREQEARERRRRKRRRYMVRNLYSCLSPLSMHM